MWWDFLQLVGFYRVLISELLVIQLFCPSHTGPWSDSYSTKAAVSIPSHWPSVQNNDCSEVIVHRFRPWDLLFILFGLIGLAKF